MEYNLSAFIVPKIMMTNDLENITVVLVEPKNPGNIGSAARAMKNMGIGRLRLVHPVDFRQHPEQKKMGYRSQDVISASQEYANLSAALTDLTLVFLATARRGKWKKDFLSPAAAAQMIREQAGREKIAIVFGREDKGVTIDECQLANYFIKIPAAISYPSLNLAQAVMVVVYEIFKAFSEGEKAVPFPVRAEKKAFERLVDNVWLLMRTLEVREPDNGLFHRSLRRALNRTHWTNADVAVFDRFCKQIRWFLQARCGVQVEEKE